MRIFFKKCFRLQTKTRKKRKTLNVGDFPKESKKKRKKAKENGKSPL